MNSQILESFMGLPQHKELFLKISSYFENQSGLLSLFVSGSAATGKMDLYSDLDLGFLCANEDVRRRIWDARWNWNIAPWFHRFDADHIKPNFVIYFFEPNLHVDFNFYLKEDLPPAAGGPFQVVWDKSSSLEEWSKQMNNKSLPKPDWRDVVHEDERFWAWMHYISSHAVRGEFYDSVSFLKDLRSIVENWEARLNGLYQFDSRRAEKRFSSHFLDEMSLTFCPPSKDGIQIALASLIRVQLRQRHQIEKQMPVSWRVKPETIAKIKSFSETLS